MRTITVILFFLNVFSQAFAGKDKDTTNNRNYQHQLSIAYGYVDYTVAFTSGKGSNRSRNIYYLEKRIIANHILIQYEHKLNDNMNLGIEYSYGFLNATYENEKSVAFIKHRILLKGICNVPIGKIASVYVNAGIGIKVYQLHKNIKYPQDDFDYFQNILPITVRAGFGFRLNVTDKLGLHLEAGLGGPLVQGGLSFRF
jgi:hypothetical protein